MNDKNKAGMESGSSPDIQNLISRLSSRDPKERERARQSLKAIGEPAITPLLKQLRSNDKWLRWEVAKTLAEMRDPHAGPIMVRYLTDKDADLRWLAAEGLIALGNNSLIPLLEALTHYSGSLWLSEGAHHVIHDLSIGREHEGEDEYQPIYPLTKEMKSIIKPIMESLDKVGSSKLTPEYAKIALHDLEQLQKEK